MLLSLETTFAVPMEEFVKREVKEVKKLKMVNGIDNHSMYDIGIS